MNIRFFDDAHIANLYPLTFTRPSADLRCGIFTIAEKWQKLLSAKLIGYKCAEYLQAKFPEIESTEIEINGKLLPNEKLITLIIQNNHFILEKAGLLLLKKGNGENKIQCDFEIQLINRPYDIFYLNESQIQFDITHFININTNLELHKSNTIIGNSPVILEEGAQAYCCTFNTQNGPIFIGKNATIMEGSLLRGPIAICESAVVKLGTKMYGGTTIGPYCTVGGEVNNIVMWGYSNKGHDGFLGNAVLGEWCNIGADSNCSNLKNTYDEVKVWNYATNNFAKSGMQFCGLIMGDHSKCGINTMFNTGTVVGVACNIFGSGFPRNFVYDFSWGGASGVVTHKMDAVNKTAALVMPRRKKEYNEIEKNIMEYVFNLTKYLRKDD